MLKTMQRCALITVALVGACASDRSTPDGQRADETAPATSTAVDETPLAPRMQFAASLAAAEAGDFGTSFHLLAQRDILAKVEIPLATLDGGAILAHFQLSNPDGVAHSGKWYALSVEADAPLSLHHDALGLDIPVQSVDTEGEMAFFYARIPVAGTNFTRYRLRGEFTATVHLDSDTGAPLVAASFVMEL